MVAGFSIEIFSPSIVVNDAARSITASEGMNVKWFSHHAYGGPEAAEVEIKGDVVYISQFLTYLRSPVNIIAPDGEKVWWGYLAKGTIKIGALELTVSLDDMYNKVSVVYNKIDPGVSGVGAQITTPAITDAQSAALYGIKELKQTLSDAFDTQATAARDALLEITKFPQTWLDITDDQGNELVGSITLTLAGWWETLSWQYYSNAAGYLGYTASGAGDRPVGAGDGISRAAHRFQIGAADPWTVYSARVRIARANNPGDYVVCSILSDAGGGTTPGTVLTSTSLIGFSINTTTDWYEFIFSTQITLQPGTWYWLQISRSGANDATNYYVVDVNESMGDPSGLFRIYNGSVWQPRSPDAHMNYEILGINQTTEQIKSIIKSIGQFFNGIRIDNNSNVFTSQYRDGTQDGLTCVNDLLKAGTSNKKRLLCEVTSTRSVRIYEEPPYQIDQAVMVSGHGLIYQGEIAIPKWKIRPGVWIVPKDVMFAFTDTMKLSGINPMLIERVEYSVSNNSVRVTPRARQSVWEIANSYAKLG